MNFGQTQFGISIKIGLWMALSACQMLHGVEPSRSQPEVRQTLEVRPTTVLPASFKNGYPAGLDGQLVRVPSLLVNTSEIVRPRTSMREGPGVQFEMADEVLPVGAKVIVFDKVGVWRKVAVIDSWAIGWLHDKMLSSSGVQTESIDVLVKSLPTIFAMHDISKALTYPESKEVSVVIPKGTFFKTIKFEGKRSLVWLAETNSVMWLNQEEVQ